MIDLNQELEDFDAYFFKRHGELPLDPSSEEYANKSYLKHEMFKAWKARAKAQAVPDTKPIAYKVSFDSWQRQHGKDYFEFWKPDEFEGYKPDYLIPLYSFPTISSDFVVVPKEPTQKMLNAAHCYMNPVKGSDGAS
ncbi:Uncharacterised protein [Acinetobacter baumannii]|nr:Uncharacterised protein [Acinetobacter baumannii]